MAGVLFSRERPARRVPWERSGWGRPGIYMLAQQGNKWQRIEVRCICGSAACYSQHIGKKRWFIYMEDSLVMLKWWDDCHSSSLSTCSLAPHVHVWPAAPRLGFDRDAKKQENWFHLLINLYFCVQGLEIVVRTNVFRFKGCIHVCIENKNMNTSFRFPATYLSLPWLTQWFSPHLGPKIFEVCVWYFEPLCWNEVDLTSGGPFWGRPDEKYCDHGFMVGANVNKLIKFLSKIRTVTTLTATWMSARSWTVARPAKLM